MEKKNRVYGVVGIKSNMSNWNADFSGQPKTTSEGNIFGSDKAFKFPIKKMWEADSNNKVLYVRSYKKEKGNVQARNLAERYEYIFGKPIKSIKDKEEVIADLFKAIDVMNFGATFAEGGNNISITGAVQVGQGYNKYDNTNVEVIEILSPFRDSTKDDAAQTTIGTKIVVDEAHYMYPFSVNPINYNIYREILKDFEGYTEEAYQEFKKACLIAATAYNTNSKIGCENELAIFVECKQDSKIYLPNLDQYILFEKNKEGKDVINLEQMSKILDSVKDEIEQVEIYYNDLNLELTGVRESYIIKSLF